jgi:hypothetical protein
MSGCRSIGPLLDGFYDRELGSVERWRVQRHLLRCESCRCELESLRHVGRYVRAAVVGVAEPDVWTSIERQLPLPARVPLRSRRSLTRHHMVWAPALAAAGAAFLFLLTPATISTFGSFDRSGASGVVRSIFAPKRTVMVLEAEKADEPTIIWLMDELGERTPEESTSVGI